MRNIKRVVKLNSQIVEKFDKDEMLMVKGGGLLSFWPDVNIYQCKCTVTINNCNAAQV